MRTLVKVFVVLLLILIALSFIMGPPPGGPGSSAPGQRFEVDVTRSRSGLAITSRGDNASDCTATINDEYAAQISVLTAGATVDVPFARFLGRGGLRFNPVTHGLRDIRVTCMQPAIATRGFTVH